MEKIIQKIIKKHYSKSAKKFRTRGWEQCGVEIEKLIQDNIDKLKQTDDYQELSYSKQVAEERLVRTKIEQIYESYFSFSNAFGVQSVYDWMNGNDKLKQLLKEK